jgi:hypothetical protein
MTVKSVGNYKTQFWVNSALIRGYNLLRIQFSEIQVLEDNIPQFESERIQPQAP